MESDNHQPAKSLPQSTSTRPPPPPTPGLTVCLANNFNLLKRFQSGDRARNKHLILGPPRSISSASTASSFNPPLGYTRVAELVSALLLDINWRQTAARLARTDIVQWNVSVERAERRDEGATQEGAFQVHRVRTCPSGTPALQDLMKCIFKNLRLVC